MAWPADKIKLDRVRALMKEQDLSALVCRAPDKIFSFPPTTGGEGGIMPFFFPGGGATPFFCPGRRRGPGGRKIGKKRTFFIKRATTIAPRPRHSFAHGIARTKSLSSAA